MRHERGPEELQRLLRCLLHLDGLRTLGGHPVALHLRWPNAQRHQQHANEQHPKRQTGNPPPPIPCQMLFQAKFTDLRHFFVYCRSVFGK